MLRGIQADLRDESTQKLVQAVGLPKGQTLDEFKKMLDEFDTQKAEVNALLKAYVKGDLQTIEALSFKDLGKPERTSFYEGMLFKRNEAWIPQIVKLAKGGTGFVAVGAAHMPGERGVLKLLENAGFKPERVTFEDVLDR